METAVWGLGSRFFVAFRLGVLGFDCLGRLGGALQQLDLCVDLNGLRLSWF